MFSIISVRKKPSYRADVEARVLNENQSRKVHRVMKDISIADVRNFVIMGHTGSGKTAIVDAILFKTAINDRHGLTDDGTSMADWTDEEKSRKISIWAKPFDGVYTTRSGKIARLVYLDTPGYADFYGQVIAASAVADAAIITVDANSGIQVGTNRAWQRAEELNLPRAIAITEIDKENADFEQTVATIQEHWGKHCIPVRLPTGSGTVANVISGYGLTDDLTEEANELRASLLELAAEMEDELIEKYLGGEELSTEEMFRGLREAIVACHLVPIFVLSGTKEIGIVPLLEGIYNLMPSPLDVPAKDIHGDTVDPSPEAPMVAHVWRSINDPFVGQLSFLRVYGGTLRADSDIYNVSQDTKEHVGVMYLRHGKKQDGTDGATAGDIVAIPKLKHASLNDTFTTPGAPRTMPDITFPGSVVEFAVTAKSQADDDKLGVGMARICEEDPTLHINRNENTHEMILSGMGDVHLSVAVERLKSRNHVEVNLSTPKIAYKETILGIGEGHYKHKKQSGGHGQYGEVYIRIEPKDPADEEWFVDKIVGGAIPNNFIPAVQKGLMEGMQKGPLSGSTVINLKATLYDGSFHDVDSSEIAFKIAAQRALREAMMSAKPSLLEPIMQVKVTVPDQFMGDITGDLNHRRGRILGMETNRGMQVIIADVPKAEMFTYSSQLRSMTGGQGSFEMEFTRYDSVPSNIAQKIIAENQKNEED